MRDSEDPGAPLPPPSDVLQSARLVRLRWMAGQQADGVLRASRPTLADGQNKGGLEQWRREEEGLAGRWGDQGAARRTASRLCSLVGF